jgi:hypothetical protein
MDGAGREDVERFLAAVRKGWRSVAVNVLNSVNKLQPDWPVERDLVLNLKSVTEQLERELRALDEVPNAQSPPELPEAPPADPLAGLTLFRDTAA